MLLIILCALIGIPLLVVALQDVFVFPGAYAKWIPFGRFEPYTPPPDVESHRLEVAPSAALEIWRIASYQKTERKLALLLHGNADTLPLFHKYMRLVADAGYDTFCFSYRGYGQSSGLPSEQNINEDAQRVWDWARKLGSEPSSTLVLGRSLGTGPAAKLAQRLRADAVVLVSPYVSIPEVTKERRFFNIFARFCRTHFDTSVVLANSSLPRVYIVHGEADTVVQSSHAQRLFDAAQNKGNIKLKFFPQADHETIFDAAKEWLSQELRVITLR